MAVQGNINYGAVGYVYGISQEELAQAAGFLQAGTPKGAGERAHVSPSLRWNSRGFPGSLIDFDFFKGGTAPYFGNEPFDHNITQAGYNAVKAGKKIERREVPCEEVGIGN